MNIDFATAMRKAFIREESRKPITLLVDVKRERLSNRLARSFLWNDATGREDKTRVAWRVA